MTPEEITEEAYDILFKGAESYAEDWMDEEGEYSEEDADKIFTRMFELLNQLREKYVYAS